MFDLTPLTGTCGARVDGADIASLAEDGGEKIVQSLAEHKVLVFRHLDGLGPDELLSFATLFGSPETAEHPSHPGVPGAPGVKVLTSDVPVLERTVDTWHTDGATRESTAWYSMLYAIQLPPFGRDTLFADSEAIFDRLSPDLQAFLEGRTALHAWGRQQPDAPPVEHPIINVNPVTGRRRLYVNRLYTTEIVGLYPDESDLLLNYFFRLATIPEVQVRVSWEPGTLVMWDNESTQHYLVRDYQFPRVHHRVMIERDVAA